MTARARFKKADAVRACQAVVAAGLKVAQIVIEPTGELRVIVDNDDGRQPAGANPLDRLLHGPN